MSCILLVGGVVGCGKTTFINFLKENQGSLFRNSSNDSDSDRLSEKHAYQKFSNIFSVLYDDLCSIEDQEKLMKTLRGWRNFRVDLLMAAEHFIAFHCGSENYLNGPLSERSYNLFKKLGDINHCNSPASKILVLVEDNFYYRSMRYDWFQIARRANIGFCQVFLTCSLDTAIYRNCNRGYQIPEEKVERMFSCLEYPDPKRYKWEKYSVIYDSTPNLDFSLLSEVIDVITKASNDPAEILINEDKITAQLICSKNAVHQADKILRKIISKRISMFRKHFVEEELLQAAISSLINTRQKILSDIRQNFICLPNDIVEKVRALGVESVQKEFEEMLIALFDELWEERSKNLNLEIVEPYL